jgi:hypothetical protein
MPKRVLIAIPITDRDASLINECFNAIRIAVECFHDKARISVDFRILVLVRVTDHEAIRIWSTLSEHETIPIEMKQVEAYEISSRHNLAAIANKRNLALAKAKENGDDNVLFIDSDILLNRNTICDLLESAQLGYDIVVSAYEVVWLGYPAICIEKDGKLNVIDLSNKDNNFARQVQIVGMGCCLIGKSCFNIPFSDSFTDPAHEVLVKSLLNGEKWADSIVYGEDVIFSFCCLAQGKSLFYTGDIVEHRYKRLHEENCSQTD